jgi:hypothetical protein
MTSFQRLVVESNNFFKLYWNPINGAQAHWSEPWHFKGPVPDGNKKGCYALFSSHELINIGVGIGKSSGIDEGSGLGSRLNNYWQVKKDKNGSQYKPTSKWQEITSIRTIAFDESHYWLAAALEIFLIHKLNPPRNTQHK